MRGHLAASFPTKTNKGGTSLTHIQANKVDNRLQGLRAVITGAAGGLGAAIAELFTSAGANLLLFDVDNAGLKALTDKLPPGTAKSITVDISQEEEVAKAAAFAHQHWGSVDILVNAAGISGRPLGDGPVHTCPFSAWQQVLAVNLTGIYLTCKHFIPLLSQSNAASVVNIASDDALIGPRPPHDTHAYIASKGGVIALTRAMAISYASQHIRVNAIAPGWVATPMTGDLMADPAAWAEVVARHPLGRAGLPTDIAYAALYLASIESAFVTGVILPVEGGANAW